jgi:N-acyl-D-aspartate/D-glutamate deacylase
MAFTYDLMIVNGMVIDPSQSLHADTRVAIKDGLVVAIGPNLDPNEACAVYDAAGKIVTPWANQHSHALCERRLAEGIRRGCRRRRFGQAARLHDRRFGG